jgi:hypothetical protein
MIPGQGYMLYRNKKESTSFKYPYFDPNSVFLESDANIVYSSAQAPMRYSHTMTLTAVADGIELQEGDVLLAISESEIRGEAPATDSLFYMSIEGDSSTPIHFVIERKGSIIATTSDVMTYSQNAIMGTPNEPTHIDFVKSEQIPQEGWYTLQGVKLNREPDITGVYIYNGRKIIIK